jgi:hypothetical protein
VTLVIYQVKLLTEIGKINWQNALWDGKEIFLLVIVFSIIAGWIYGKCFKSSIWEQILLFLPVYLIGVYIGTKFLFVAVGFTSQWLGCMLAVLILLISDVTSRVVASLSK